MAKVFLTKEDERKETVRRVIRDGMYENGTNRVTTAERAGVKAHVLYNMLNKHPEDMRLRDLWRVLDALKVPNEDRAKILR